VQSFVYGFTGLRIDNKGLSEAYPPTLPLGWKSLMLKNIVFRGKRYNIVINRDPNGKARLTRTTL
jgi:protein-glucosylgalactosylhydroxylysine glucosidase